MQWRKLIDHNPLFTVLSDKLRARDFIAEKCPDLKLPEILWAGSDIAGVARRALDGDVVVKRNNGSGFNYFVKRGTIDFADLEKVARSWQAKSYGRTNREWAYGEIVPSFFVERLVTLPGQPLIDINIRAGKGRFAYSNVLLNQKTPAQSAIYYDRQGQVIEVLCGDGVSEAQLTSFSLPSCYERAVRYALKLSEELDYARFDFLWNGEDLYGGEVTIYPASGYGIQPTLAPSVLGAWDIRDSWFWTTEHSGWRARYQEVLRANVHLLEDPALRTAQRRGLFAGRSRE